MEFLLGLSDADCEVAAFVAVFWSVELNTLPAEPDFGDSREPLRKLRLNLLFFASCCACSGTPTQT